MNFLTRPTTLIAIGLVLMLLGVALPFLIVTKVLESSFFLNFFAFTASVGGLMLGIVGIAMVSRRKNDPFE